MRHGRWCDASAGADLDARSIHSVCEKLPWQRTHLRLLADNIPDDACPECVRLIKANYPATQLRLF